MDLASERSVEAKTLACFSPAKVNIWTISSARCSGALTKAQSMLQAANPPTF
jgi:hypothetical protein